MVTSAFKRTMKLIPHIPLYQLLLFFVFALLILVAPFSYQSSTVSNKQDDMGRFPIKTSEKKPIAVSTPALYPVKNNGEIPPSLSARAIVAVDVDSNAILFTSNEQMPLWPASTTKLMTAIVALDLFKLDDVVTVRGNLPDGRVMGLVDGEKITVENLLYGILIHSANDAAFVLASFHPQGVEGFIKAMNDRAQTLSLDNTHFANPAGFDDVKQYTTASDLTRLSLYALNNPIIVKMVGIPSIVIADDTFIYFHSLTNVNKLLGVMPGVAGMKTGWTENAKENLVNLTKRDGHRILTVILGSDDRFGETATLTNWLFANYHWIDLAYATDQSTRVQ